MTMPTDDNVIHFANTEERILCAHSEGRISKIEAFEALQELCGLEPLQAKGVLEALVEFVKEQESIQ